MPSFLQWITSTAAKPKRYRIYAIYGSDACLRADALDRAIKLSNPQEREFFHVGSGEGEVNAARVWDAVETQPMPGVLRRLVVVHHADKMREWDSLQSFIAGTAMYPETTLVLVLDRVEIGRRVRNPTKSLPGAPVWETSYEDWEESLRSYSNAALISCGGLTSDAPDRSKPSSAARWLSLRLPVSQPQAQYLWSRAGGSSLLARDVVRSLRLRGLKDATTLSVAEFAAYVDQIIGQHGAEDLVELMLFDRRAEAMASVLEQDFSSSDWSRILGLLGQRLDWLSALHGALGTNERLDQVQRRLQIPRHLILHYAHREDPKHNIARKFDDKRVKRNRLLIAEFDSRLSNSNVLTRGFGEAFLASWS